MTSGGEGAEPIQPLRKIFSSKAFPTYSKFWRGWYPKWKNRKCKIFRELGNTKTFSKRLQNCQKTRKLRNYLQKLLNFQKLKNQEILLKKGRVPERCGKMTYLIYLLKSVMFLQSSNLFPCRSEEFQWSFEEVAWKSEFLFELYIGSVGLQDCSS